MIMDTQVTYAVVPAEQHARDGRIARTESELADVRRELREMQGGYETLGNTVAAHQVALGGLGIAIIVVLAVSWLRGREAKRIRVLLQEQERRLNEQDKRISNAVEDMAAERAELATERQRLGAVVDDVRSLGAELKTDLAASVERAQEFHAQQRKASEGMQRDAMALIAQLQMIGRKLGNAPS